MTILDDGINVLGSTFAGGGGDTTITATAGTPGHYDPTTPADLASGALTAVPSPGTAWTAGQYVVLGDGTEVFWDGEVWAEGRAPALEGDEPDTLSADDVDYDPADYSVAEVRSFLTDNPDQTEAVVERERQGRNRTSIIRLVESDES